MKNYDEMADSILKRRDAYFEKRAQQKRMLARYGIPTVCICLIGGLSYWILGMNFQRFPDVPLTESQAVRLPSSLSSVGEFSGENVSVPLPSYSSDSDVAPQDVESDRSLTNISSSHSSKPAASHAGTSIPTDVSTQSSAIVSKPVVSSNLTSSTVSNVPTSIPCRYDSLGQLQLYILAMHREPVTSSPTSDPTSGSGPSTSSTPLNSSGGSSVPSSDTGSSDDDDGCADIIFPSDDPMFQPPGVAPEDDPLSPPPGVAPEPVVPIDPPVDDFPDLPPMGEVAGDEPSFDADINFPELSEQEKALLDGAWVLFEKGTYPTLGFGVIKDTDLEGIQITKQALVYEYTLNHDMGNRLKIQFFISPEVYQRNLQNVIISGNYKQLNYPDAVYTVTPSNRSADQYTILWQDSRSNQFCRVDFMGSYGQMVQLLKSMYIQLNEW